MNQKQLAQNLAQIFQKSNHQLYLVGGAVRDELMNKTPKELDFTTDAQPDEIKKILNNIKTKNIYTIGERFGTIGGYIEEIQVEITTYRSESYLPGSRHPEVQFGKTLKEDLSRRDFTINAIAYNPITNEYIDPFAGQTDLKNKLIRVVGNKERLTEDPLRILRAIRFAVTLNFDIEEKTKQYIIDSAPEIGSISVERISQEMDKILISDKPADGIRLLAETGIINYILPEIIAMQSVQHEANQHKNIYEHTLTVLSHVPPTKKLRWLALLHDIAKPQTKSIENGEVHFLLHEIKGAQMARNILQRLHYDNQFTKEVTELIKLHLRVNLYQPSWTDGAVRRLMLEAGDLLDDLITFSYADITSARQYKVDQGHQRIDGFKDRAEKVRAEEELNKIKSPLSGDELMEVFNKPAGPWIKPIKDYLLNKVIDGELSQDDKESAKKLSKEFSQK